MYSKINNKLHLRELKDESELLVLIQLFEEFGSSFILPYTQQHGIIAFQNVIARGSYLRLIMLNNEIRGFVLADLNPPLFCSTKVLQQLYYVCNLKNLEAIKALILTHNTLIQYAENLKIPHVMSQCSFLDEKNKLTKILEKLGWKRFGYVAIWNTSHSNNPSSYPETSRLND